MTGLVYKWLHIDITWLISCMKDITIFISEIRSRFSSNLLNLNDNKLDEFILASPRYIHTVIDNVMHVGDISISLSQFVMDLDFMFDETLNMK